MIQYTYGDFSSAPTNTGVYGIYFKNSEIRKYYIGSAASVHTKWPSQGGFAGRWKGHIRQLKKGAHHSCLLQRACDKYGIENAIFFVVEECPPELCEERETFHIKKYESFAKGYNILEFAYSSVGRKASAETINKFKNVFKGKRERYRDQVLGMYSQKKTVPAISKILGISPTMIYAILQDDGVNKRGKHDLLMKEIFCFKLNGEFVGKWKHAGECAEELKLKGRSAIGDVASGKTLQYRGYFFRYYFLKPEEVIKEFNERKADGAKGWETRRRTVINQYDLQGKLIKQWESYKKICEFFEIQNPYSLKSAIKNKKDWKGFKWEIEK